MDTDFSSYLISSVLVAREISRYFNWSLSMFELLLFSDT